MKQSKIVKKPYWKMNAAELAAATKEFDHPLPPDRFKPLSGQQRARFDRLRNASGPNVQNVYAFDLDPALMDEAVKYAKRKKMTLPQLIERGVRGVMAFSE